MKREIRGFLVGVLVTSLLTGTLAFASQGTKIIEAFYDDIKIFIYGSEVTPRDAGGAIVEPFRYNGTTYLPVRAISEALGHEVTWVEEAKSVYIGNLPAELHFAKLDERMREAEKEPVTEVTVSTVDELISELGSNKVINLKPGVYDLSKATIESTDNVYWSEVYDGLQLNIKGLVNLVLSGDENEKTEIVTTPSYAEILNFEDCGNITILNIRAGHTPREYECDAGVLSFYNCKSVSVYGCYLYGCGSIGISLNFVDNFLCKESIITDCSLRGIDIFNSTNIEFVDTKITKNRAYASVISVSSDSTVTFTGCEISENNNIEWDLIEASGNSILTFNDCIIKDNQTSEENEPNMFNSCWFDFLDSATIALNNCIIENNKSWIEYNGEKPIYNDCVFNDNDFLN